MESTETNKTVVSFPIVDDDENRFLVQPFEHAQTSKAAEIDSTNHANHDFFLNHQHDIGEPQGPGLLSWHPDFTDRSSNPASNLAGVPQLPPHSNVQEWNVPLSAFSQPDQGMSTWRHNNELSLAQSAPTWEIGQGAARLYGQPSAVQIPASGLPRRRSRYLLSSGMEMNSTPISAVAPGPITTLENSMDPMQRWRNSPPDTEAAPLSAIVDALRHTQLRVDTPTNNVSGRRMDTRPKSISSFASDSSVSSGSTASINSAVRRGRVTKRNRPSTGKRQTTGPKKFCCTFCCDSFKSKHDWARHEQSLHLSVQGWLCAPFGSTVTSPATGVSSCAYCGVVDPTPSHLEDHNSDQCEKDQVYSRKDQLVQHLRCIHHIQNPPEMNSWKIEGPPVSSRCGFCELRLESWQERVDHLGSHFSKGKTMDDWKGDHGFEADIAAQVHNAIPPYFIASESKTYAPFSAADPNPTNVEHVKQISRSAEESFEVWNSSSTQLPMEPMASLKDKSFPELLAFHLGRFAQHHMSLGIIPTDKMFQDEARRLQFGNIDPLDDTIADNEQWLSKFRSQYIELEAGSQDRSA